MLFAHVEGSAWAAEIEQLSVGVADEMIRRNAPTA
jgi:hypothetical protein